jgi:arsenate reductase (thioredoxin)
MFKKPVIKFRVMFVDQKNDSTSQLAEYFTRQMFSEIYDVYSAGPEHDIVDCDMISVMYQSGEDMRRQVSKDFKNTELLREDGDYDAVVYLAKTSFDEWASRTPWQGKQIFVDMGSVKDYTATDDAELAIAYEKLIAKVRSWVSENMKDPNKLKMMMVNV